MKDFTINEFKSDFKSIKLSDCESCQIGKFHELVSYKPLKSPKETLVFFDSDICGPFRTIGLKGERYFFTFTDRKSRAAWVYAIKAKSDALDILIAFYKLIENQFSIKIKGFRLDNAREFKSNKWNSFIKDKGIIYKYTSPYTPTQNGIAEILNKYIINRLISIYKEKNIPLKL